MTIIVLGVTIVVIVGALLDIFIDMDITRTLVDHGVHDNRRIIVVVGICGRQSGGVISPNSWRPSCPEARNDARSPLRCMSGEKPGVGATLRSIGRSMIMDGVEVPTSGEPSRGELGKRGVSLL